MLWGSLIIGALATGAAHANPGEPPQCPPVASINDWDTDDIVWLQEGPYSGVLALSEFGAEFRVLEQDGSLVMHASVQDGEVYWEVRPTPQADLGLIKRLVATTAACTDAPEMVVLRRALRKPQAGG